jgi:hypothetical protein
MEHKLLHQSFMMYYDLRYSVSLNDFVSMLDPIGEWHEQEMITSSLSAKT